ncbi:MAG: sugar phosphate isomerase/epimerase [Acidobacteriota bacterium]|nr:sugar phosphate isomerase/epimerase [Acidobacteriota bacterium]
MMNRRNFLIGVAAAHAASNLTAQTKAAIPKFTACFFSKHLANLDYEQMGKAVHEAGFDGLDLTVRPGGHVLPANVERDLPRAVETLRTHGLEVPMITTELNTASDPAARPILSTAGRLKIPYFKLGYWKYTNDPEASVRNAIAGVSGLTALAKEYGVVAGFHNHPRNVGLCGWDGKQVLQGLDPKWVGYYFDANNATEEGGVTGWEVLLRLESSRLKMAAFKDFYWDKVKGKWSGVACPLGQGMVNWDKVFPILAAAGFSGPFSIHQEYKPSDRMTAAAADLQFVKKGLHAAYASVS